jgi:hypothetical protein
MTVPVRPCRCSISGYRQRIEHENETSGHANRKQKHTHLAGFAMHGSNILRIRPEPRMQRLTELKQYMKRRCVVVWPSYGNDLIVKFRVVVRFFACQIVNHKVALVALLKEARHLILGVSKRRLDSDSRNAHGCGGKPIRNKRNASEWHEKRRNRGVRLNPRGERCGSNR